MFSFLTRWSPLLALVVSCAATEARAWEVFVQVSCETTLRGSSETSTAASRADRVERRRNAERQNHYAGGAPAGTQCESNDECYGWCDNGRCVDNTATQPAAPVVQNTPRAGPTAINCTGDESCAPGYQCLDGQCVARPPPEPMPVPMTRCESDTQCAPGQRCLNSQCLSPPPMPPSSSLPRKGTELYLTSRLVQLREDLALGEGPVISTLAAIERVPASTLGRQLRARRAELMKLVGDGTDERWAGKFLTEVEALSAPRVQLSVR